MKKLLLVLVAFFAAVPFYANSLREYAFGKNTVPTASLPYSSDVTYEALLYCDFTAFSAQLEDCSASEVVDVFNSDLKQKLSLYGVTLYSFEIPVAMSESSQFALQDGTIEYTQSETELERESVVNFTSSADTVLSGSIDAFFFEGELSESFVAVTLELCQRDSGEILWNTTLSGLYEDVLKYIATVLSSAPVDNSMVMTTEEIEEIAEEEIVLSLPVISCTVSPETVTVKDPAKLPSVTFNLSVESSYYITSWSVVVSNDEGAVVAEFTGEGDVDSKVIWDLTDLDGNTVPFDSDYTAMVTVSDELRNTISQPAEFSVVLEVAE